MESGPTASELESVGLDPSRILSASVLRQRPAHRVYRIHASGASYVLKCFSGSEVSKEIRCYELLGRHGVPTLPVHAKSDRAILLEDLDYSQAWCRAEGYDGEARDLGAAIAIWYKMLHRTGYRILGEPHHEADFLQEWVSQLNPLTLESAGRRLGVSQESAWKYAIDNVDSLCREFRRSRPTLNYNDFYFGNLAVSKGRAPVEAIVFDYDSMVTGPAYTDYRNVSLALEGAARDGFQEAYGPTDEREAILDGPLSVIHGAVCASERETLPQWGRECVREVLDGRLRSSMDRALGYIAERD